MKAFTARVRFISAASVSALAMLASAQPVFAQTVEEAPADDGDAIVVTGIRASLKQSLDIKRAGQGVVDAISAEDIGKFPDTNLAESLQRITGVSIDRNSGEGSTVTVRGFGPDFNLVVLNGRQMPTSSLGGSSGAPASRSFDFGNLASEGISGVEVYKSGRATLASGGIGSVINIKTARPLDRSGFQGSIGAKAVYDTSRFDSKPITPEVSGIVSDTFADGRIGILLSGSYQLRKGSQAQFNAGWREGYLGNENNWGSLAMEGSPGFANITNRPGPTDTYQVTQNAGYDFTSFKRERINGQAVLQFKPTDTLVATVDYTYSSNKIDARTNSIGVWFNHGDTSSSWTDGPAAGPNFYAERFGPGKDLAITGAVAANRSENNSIGGNVKWDGPGGLRLELDGHHSTAESKPTSPYGSGIAVGAAIFGVQSQKIDFTSDIPVISVTMFPGSEINAANIRPAGNAFRNAYMRDEINEVSLRGGYDFDSSIIDSLDFGVTYTDNKVSSAFGVIQNDTWGGTLSSADTPDSLFGIRNLPEDLKGLNGSNDPAIIPNYFQVDTVGLINLLDSRLGICGSAQTAGTCLAKYTADRTVHEKTWAPYIQSAHKFDLGEDVANLRLGLRYERTTIDSSALVPIPTGTVWTGGNETAIIYGTTQAAASLNGRYENWLPAIDFDMSPIRNVKLRASYSHTITRPDYASLQGGTTLDSPIRIGGSTGASGNPGLLPYKSKNIDLSAEWYYGPTSYISVGYFHKNVGNFISQTQVNTPAFALTNAAAGPDAAAARAALGANATPAQLVAFIAARNPSSFNSALNGINGQSTDPLVNFIITRPTNSDQKAKLSGWEFAIQHNFWETGFGTILNYTIVNSDTQFDNTLRYTVPQFAVQGVSDSANAVLYYDKNGLQGRVAYNWRGSFLSGYGFDPFYTNAYGQFDVSASYEFTNGVTVFVEGINVTNADRKGHMRNDQTVFFAAPGYARYAAGARFKF
ncbi:TonB-dependent receptor [Novosphingobium hassiacum]|uniref:TonB-dependent receptor n=1 Tax=Novosphingobium hassiacum TaxID=173676 RepID=A0A7W5ZU96_9SPHN|nr:TonB-dependent receptor [Novosphingobium hassiacum]MBB3859601.1 TonB-dependent receptor [Novosphingobium hassiacum]